jgi:Uma2 family endonuclease
MSTAIVPSSAPAQSTATPQTSGASGKNRAATSILIDGRIEIPLGITSLEDFRQWARSDAFPDQGRIDYIGGRIEVDLMVENLFYHGAAKAEIARVVGGLVAAEKSGRWFIDCTRISHTEAELSSEPDLVFLSFQSISAKRVGYVPARTDPDSFIEVEGSPDWICEIVSDRSEQKDTIRLAEKYFAAGVTEYWLVDARGESLDFSILTRGKNGFVPVETDAEGYQTSSVFQRRYHFTRDRGPDGHWVYHLDEQSLTRGDRG